jgi:hypothetical protein
VLLMRPWNNICHTVYCSYLKGVDLEEPTVLTTCADGAPALHGLSWRLLAIWD